MTTSEHTFLVKYAIFKKNHHAVTKLAWFLGRTAHMY